MPLPESQAIKKKSLYLEVISEGQNGKGIFQFGGFSTFWYFIIIVISFYRTEIKALIYVHIYIYVYKKSTIHKNMKILK